MGTSYCYRIVNEVLCLYLSGGELGYFGNGVRTWVVVSVAVKVVDTVSDRRHQLIRHLRSGGASNSNDFHCIRNALNNGRMVLARYNVNGIDTTMKTSRLVQHFSPSYVIDANITNNVSTYLGIASMITDRHLICRSI